MTSQDKEFKRKQELISIELLAIYLSLVDNSVDLLSIDAILASEKYFVFSDYQKINPKIDALIEGVKMDIDSYIKSENENVWVLSNTKNDIAIDKIYQKHNKVAPSTLKQANLSKLEAFQKSKTFGETISERVWTSNANLKKELESAVNAAIEKGQSPKQLAKDIKKYLKEPDKRFRRIRDKFGTLKPSKNSLMYRPGQGVYRSSYANALRLARTEIQKAYRLADWNRWQQNPLIAGYQIIVAKRKNVCDICLKLAGLYPKDFKFLLWHPNCQCIAIPVYGSPEEIYKIINGQDIKISQPPMPDSYLDYIEGLKDK